MSTYSSHFDDAFPARPRPARRVGETVFGRITVWLVLAMAAGVWIAISDGLTRDYIADYDTLPIVQVLTYEAYKAAWVFAGVVLPFILLHGKRLGFSLWESYLLWFVLCTTAYTKDFAYLKIPGAPIFITNVTLVVFVLSVFVWPRLRIPRLNNLLMQSLLFFLALGLVGAARGVAMHMVATDVLRDLSIVIYAVFMPVALFARRAKALARQYCLMLICGAIIGTLTGVSWYIGQPDMRRYILYGIYVPMAFLLIALLMWAKRMKLTMGIPLLLLLGWGILVCNARTTYLGLAATLALMVFTGFAQLRLREAIKPIIIAIVVMAIAVTTMMQTKEGADYLGRITVQLVQGFAQTGGDDNAQWRLLAWAEAGRRFVVEPVMGEGFGVPFTFEKSSINVKPHNIFLTILYKMGIVGFAPFVVFLAISVFGPWRTMRRYRFHPDSLLLRGLFLCQFFALSFGAINPLIESPFLASMFWLNLGFMVRISRQIRADSESSAMAQAA